MKLIEAEKVVQAIKDYWKAQVDRMPTPYSTEEFEKLANHVAMCLEYRDDLLKAIDELPSAEPDTTTHGSNVVKKGINDGDRTSGDCISRQQAVDALRAMQTYKMFAGDDLLLIDQAGAQTELMMLPSVQPERPTGEWIQKPRYEDDEYPDAQPNLKCPFCGYEIGWCDMGNYCARCGADLKGGAE